jgi:hypothetical protein
LFFAYLKTSLWGQVQTVHTCNPDYSGGRAGGLWFEASLGKQLMRPYLKKLT